MVGNDNFNLLQLLEAQNRANVKNTIFFIINQIVACAKFEVKWVISYTDNGQKLWTYREIIMEEDFMPLT